MNFTTQLDPAQLARAIRSLAHDAHAILRQAPSRTALEKLSVRIQSLRLSLGDQREAPVGVWLSHLDSKVKAITRLRATEVRTTCGCV